MIESTRIRSALTDGIEVTYRGAEAEVIAWLHENIQHDSISDSGVTGFDRVNRVIFGVYASRPMVYFKHQKDAVLFALRWS